MNGIIQVTSVIFLLFITSTINAQEIKVKSFSIQEMELMTVPIRRTDMNGNVCALVKVIVPSSQASFEGSIIGDCEYHTSEYWCYLAPKSKYLRVKCPNSEPLMVNFGSKLESGRIYELRLEIPDLEMIRHEITNDSLLSKSHIEKILSEISKVNPDYIHPRRGKLYPFIKDNCWGFLDESFRLVIPAIYSDFNNSTKISERDNNWQLWMDLRENFKWEQDFYWVKLDKLWGCIDNKGRTLIPFKYSDIYEPMEDYSKCRIAVVGDTLGTYSIINRNTGEVYQTNLYLGGHRNSRYLIRQPSILHILAQGKKKDIFVDKITGQKIDFKIPKNYEFRDFLPFSHLSFFNSKDHKWILTDNQGNICLDTRWNYPDNVTDANNFEFLCSIQGIYSLEDGKFIYNEDSRNSKLVNNHIVDIRWGVHHAYVDLINRSTSDTLPNISDGNVSPKYWDLIRQAWSSEKKDFSVYDVTYLEHELYLLTSNNCGIILIDQYGNFGQLKNGNIEYGILGEPFHFIRKELRNSMTGL